MTDQLERGKREYDIFLSHAFSDRDLIGPAHAELTALGYSVYVDWIDDSHLDRSRVDAATADLLRRRIRRCGSLFYAVSTRAAGSRWMPWELGYGDALTGRVFIYPLDETAGDWARGQEYLSLYDVVDRSDLPAFLHARVPRVRDEMLRPGDYAVTAAGGARVAENLPRLMLDPALAAEWMAAYWRAWQAMMGLPPR